MPMQVLDSLSALKSLGSPVHWAMGFFDGVHLGHQCVIRSANSPGALRGVLTFDRHPLALLHPEKQPCLITPNATLKASLIATAGNADVLLRLPFTPELAAMEPGAFLDALCGSCRIAGISVGSNWRFGRGGCGSADFLRREGQMRGFPVYVHELVQQDGISVSSTCIRAALAGGDLPAATRMLGHSFAVAGEVEHGQHLARKLGFPTANISLPPHAALPACGVYRVRCQHAGALLSGIANLGLRPTIREERKIPRLEAHFPGWQGDLYGQFLSIELLDFLRPERRFASLDELRRQIALDLSAIS